MNVIPGQYGDTAATRWAVQVDLAGDAVESYEQVAGRKGFQAGEAEEVFEVDVERCCAHDDKKKQNGRLADTPVASVWLSKKYRNALDGDKSGPKEKCGHESHESPLFFHSAATHLEDGVVAGIYRASDFCFGRALSMHSLLL
ncbi:MAG TPA: hypothetical protein DDZ58_00135 [Achromobacter sp.]|nr:hypothetical protein [Achromobacter sp.]